MNTTSKAVLMMAMVTLMAVGVSGTASAAPATGIAKTNVEIALFEATGPGVCAVQGIGCVWVLYGRCAAAVGVFETGAGLLGPTGVVCWA